MSHKHLIANLRIASSHVLVVVLGKAFHANGKFNEPGF